MQLVRLSLDYDISAFDCGDEDLNDFLLRDAKDFLCKRIANTFVLEDNGKVAAYFSLLNDKISRLELTNSRWATIRDSFPESKRFRSYPSIKIGRFAVSLEYRHQNIGSDLLALIKNNLANSGSVSAFRFITVDAYLKAIDFYRHNGFQALNRKDEDKNTRLMYFDMLEI